MLPLLLFLSAAPLLAQSSPDAPPDAATIMAKVAANVEAAAESRRRYVYQQHVRSSLVRASGDVARKEKREYSVIPGENGTEKKLVSFSGEYRKGKQMIAYTEPGYKHKGADIDAELIDGLTEGLVNDKKSRDGIPHSLFPLSSKDLPYYRFTLEGTPQLNGRRTYQIAFEPHKIENCLHLGKDDDNVCDVPSWKGEAWIDAEEFQPVRIETHLAFQIPWGVRVFLGTNFRQTGFSIHYTRVAPNVWFPLTYGTEFRFNVLWGYKRTVTLSMESDGFRKTDANSKIEYQTPTP